MVETLAFQANDAGSIPVSRSRHEGSRFLQAFGDAGLPGPCGSVVEHSLGKGEVAGPIPMGTRSIKGRPFHVAAIFVDVWLVSGAFEKWQRKFERTKPT